MQSRAIHVDAGIQKASGSQEMMGSQKKILCEGEKV